MVTKDHHESSVRRFSARSLQKDSLHTKTTGRAVGRTHACHTVDAKSFFLFHSPLQHAQASIAGDLVASMMRIVDQHCMTIVRVTQQLLMLASDELEREDGKRGGHKALLSCRAGEQ